MTGLIKPPAGSTATVKDDKTPVTEVIDNSAKSAAKSATDSTAKVVVVGQNVVDRVSPERKQKREDLKAFTQDFLM
ncbi:hypothetical protein BGZ94_005058, partial [Podila epigama]